MDKTILLVDDDKDIVEFLQYYREHTEDATALLAVGKSPRDPQLDVAEHAAWTMLVNQLMNLDEVLCK